MACQTTSTGTRLASAIRHSSFHTGGVKATVPERNNMPSKSTIERARADERAGKSPSTQAGEFVREEIHHVREGTHGARSTKQAIAIGLSKARRASVKLGRPPRSAKPGTRKS